MALDKFTQITKSGIVTTINFECHHLYSTGIATFSSGNISAVDGTFTGDVSIGGTLTYQDVTNIDSVGLVTARLGLNVTAGVSTFAAAIDANGGANIAGGLVVNSAKISDLTDNRVVIGGSSGELEDSANLTFDGSNLGVGSKVTVTNANADADNPNSLGAEINAAWIRLGDVTAAKSFSNGLGIKYYDQGTSHWSTGTIGNKFYISNTSNDGNKLFPSGRTDVVTCDTTGKVGVGTVTPGNTVHLGGTQGVGVRWHNYTSGNSAYHTLESGDKFQSNVGGSGEHTWISAGATKMTLTNAGRLGIGTAIPVGKFESYNTGLSTPTKTWGGGNPGQRLVNEGSELKIGLTAYSPYAYFLQANTSSGTDRQLTLNPMGGSVGIGLTNAQTDAGLVARYSNTHAPSLTWNTAGGHTLRNEGSELVFGLSNSSPHPYFLQARTSGNAAKQLVLNPLGGNVGIHETSPEEILDLGESNQQNLKLGQRGYLGQAYSTTATILGHSVKADTTNTVASQMMVTETNSGGGAPAAIRLVSGTIQFHTAGSGTANAVFDSERLRIDSGGSVTIGDAATHSLSAHSEGDDLVIGGAGWRGMTIYGEGGGGVIQFADNGDNRRGQIMYNHGNDSMMFRTGGNADRLTISNIGEAKFTRVNSGGTVGHFYANQRECNILLQNDAKTWKIVNYDYGNNGTDFLGFHDGTADRLIITDWGLILGRTSNYWDSTAVFQRDHNARTHILVKNDTNGANAESAISLNAYGNSYKLSCGAAGNNSNAFTIARDATGNSGAGYEKFRLDTNDFFYFNTTDNGTTNGNIGARYNWGSDNNLNFGMHCTTRQRYSIWEHRQEGRTQQRTAQMSCGENGSNQGTVVMYSSTANADVTGGVNLTNGATSWSGNSDMRLKNKTGDILNALEDINKIEPIRFTWKYGTDNNPHVGVSAQSVENVVPEAIDRAVDVERKREGDETEYMQVRYTELIPLSIAAIKELKSEVESLKAEIASLKES